MIIYKTSSGKVLQRNNMVVEQRDIYAFELEVSGTSFPDRSDGVFTYAPFADTICYINCNDGVGERIYDNSIIYFQDVPSDKLNTIDPTYSIKRKINIRFQSPKKVKSMYFSALGLLGKMPLELGYYNFASFFVNQKPINTAFLWDTFSPYFRGLKADVITLRYAFKTYLNYLPNWFVYGYFINVYLEKVFDLSRSPDLTGLDKLHNINGLTILELNQAALSPTSFADNLKLIPTLRTLTLIFNYSFSYLPDSIGNCQQLTYLKIASCDFRTWGNGIGNMLNLITLQFDGNPNMTTDLPNGMANCVKLKQLLFYSSFNTLIKADTFVNNLYTFIVSNASTSAGNTKFRTMEINIMNIRPSGTYQDSTTPSTPMEKIYKMVKVYNHTWKVRNAAYTGTEILAP